MFLPIENYIATIAAKLVSESIVAGRQSPCPVNRILYCTKRHVTGIWRHFSITASLANKSLSPAQSLWSPRRFDHLCLVSQPNHTSWISHKLCQYAVMCETSHRRRDVSVQNPPLGSSRRQSHHSGFHFANQCQHPRSFLANMRKNPQLLVRGPLPKGL